MFKTVDRGGATEENLRYWVKNSKKLFLDLIQRLLIRKNNMDHDSCNLAVGLA
jgi:hypothetical protein